MSHVLTLIAAPDKTPLTDGHVEAVGQALERDGVEAGRPDWLSEGEACDIPFTGEPARAREAAQGALAGAAIDVAALPTARRRKRLLIADMDSTLIEQEVIDELASLAGVGERVAAITERAMRGEIAFEPALVERVALLAGLDEGAVERLLAERITPMPGGRTLVQTVRANGGFAALVTGGFTAFAGPIAQRLGFDVFRANVLLTEQGYLTGRVAPPILGREAKTETLAELLARHGLDARDALAVGDGANDIGMVRLAGLGVAFRAKPALQAAADAIVEHGDLTALLFLQGYRRAEFVR